MYFVFFRSLCGSLTGIEHQEGSEFTNSIFSHNCHDYIWKQDSSSHASGFYSSSWKIPGWWKTGWRFLQSVPWNTWPATCCTLDQHNPYQMQTQAPHSAHFVLRPIPVQPCPDSGQRDSIAPCGYCVHNPRIRMCSKPEWSTSWVAVSCGSHPVDRVKTKYRDLTDIFKLGENSRNHSSFALTS